MTKIATVCMNVVYDKKKNLEKYLSYIDEAASKGASLVVFPEQSLQGYLPSLTNFSLEALDYQYTNAEVVPDGECVSAIVEKAIEKNIHVVFGMTERDGERYDVLYNTAVLVGPEGYIGRYRKVHQPLDELHVYHPGDSFPVFETQIGRIGMLICYDKAFPESARELALGGADILVMPTAWPLSSTEDVENDPTLALYKLYDQVRALENQVYFVSSNQYGRCGEIDYCAHSTITAPDGTVLATTGYAEGVAVCEVDVVAGILAARGGLTNTLKDRNPSAYRRLIEGVK